MSELKDLDTSKDLELMVEFRNLHWDLWVEHCEENGYKAEVTE